MDRLPRSTPQAPLQPPTSKSTSLPLPLPLPLPLSSSSSSSSASQESSGHQHALLKHFFGFGSFRPLQQAIINAAIRKYDTFVCMATASGNYLLAFPFSCTSYSPSLTFCSQISNREITVLSASSINYRQVHCSGVSSHFSNGRSSAKNE